jgi:hypothetical protein
MIFQKGSGFCSFWTKGPDPISKEKENVPIRAPILKAPVKIKASG